MEIREKIRVRLDVLFVDAPKSRAAFELQEELLANCTARYEDLTHGGMDPDSAFEQVFSSIGDVDELIRALPGDGAAAGGEREQERRNASAMVSAVAVGLYIVAAAVLFIGLFVSTFYGGAFLIGLILATLICVVPTCMLVYNASRWPQYQKQADTMVESFKQWSNDSAKARSLRKAVSSVLWTLTVAVYLAISFVTFAWWITWVIFPIAACIEAVINLLFRLKEMG